MILVAILYCPDTLSKFINEPLTLLFISCIHVCFRHVFSIFNICISSICILNVQYLHLQCQIFVFAISKHNTDLWISAAPTTDLYLSFPIFVFVFSISNICICIFHFQYLYLQFPSAARTGCSGRVTSGYPPLRPQAAHEKWQFRAERSIVQIQIQKQKQKQIQIQTQ